MKETNKKFDKVENYVERLGKLILKIVTTLAAIALGVMFAWNQLHDSIPRHVHQEDEEFQAYLMDMETSSGYAEEVDSLYEDSLYSEYYHLEDEIAE